MFLVSHNLSIVALYTLSKSASLERARSTPVKCDTKTWLLEDADGVTSAVTVTVIGIHTGNLSSDDSRKIYRSIPGGICPVRYSDSEFLDNDIFQCNDGTPSSTFHVS